MINKIKNPIELFDFINILSLVTPPNRKNKHHFKKLIFSRLGNKYNEQQELAKKKLELLDDRGKLDLATEGLKKLQEEDKEDKKEILTLIEDIIFFDHQVLPAERKFYKLAQKFLKTKSHPITPSIEFFEYLHVLSFISRSEFANIRNFTQVWKKFMGPDIVYYYTEAKENLKNLSLEEQIFKIGENLQNMSELSLEEKTNIRSMVEEIILFDNKFTKQEKIIYDLLLENLNIESNLDLHLEKFDLSRFFSKIELSPFFVIFINIIIVFTGIVVGLETNPKIAKDFAIEFFYIDIFIKYIFLIEIVMRFLSLWKNSREFFLNSWNCFDLILVIASFLPFGNYPFILRLLRLARFVRIINQVHQLRIISLSLVHSIKPTGFVCVLLFMLIYVYGVIGTTLFADNDPVHFGSLALSMSSLLQTTFEGWTDILYIQMYGCRNYGYSSFGHLCNDPSEMPVTSLIFFLSFIIINSFVIINLVIGIIIDNMNVTRQRMQKEDDLEKTVKNLDYVISKVRSKRLEKMMGEIE